MAQTMPYRVQVHFTLKRNIYFCWRWVGRSQNVNYLEWVDCVIQVLYILTNFLFYKLVTEEY